MIFVVLFVSIASAAALNLTQFETYTVNFDATCLQYFFLQGTEEYIYFYRKSYQFELWIARDASNYEIYASPQQKVLVFKWPDLTINGLKMDLVFHKGEIGYPLSFVTETILCKINEISGTGFAESSSAVYEHRVESAKHTLLAAGLLCLLTLTIGIFVALVSNFKKESQTEANNTYFVNTEAVYKHSS